MECCSLSLWEISTVWDCVDNTFTFHFLLFVGVGCFLVTPLLCVEALGVGCAGSTSTGSWDVFSHLPPPTQHNITASDPAPEKKWEPVTSCQPKHSLIIPQQWPPIDQPSDRLKQIKGRHTDGDGLDRRDFLRAILSLEKKVERTWH